MATTTTCVSCGGELYELLEGFDACPRCGIRQNDGRILAETLDAICTMVRRYVVLPNDSEAHAIALWVAQTHLLDAFDVVMFLHVFSPEPESGKTRLLEVLSKLVRGPWLVSRPTAATLFRMIEERQPTLLWDEIDRVFSVKQVDASTADLQAVVNSGHKRGAVVPRCVGEGKNLKVKDFPVFTSMAFAGINQLKLPDTVRSRSIPIALRRRAPDEEVRRWREREADEMAAPILAQLQTISLPMAGPLRDARPKIPEDLGDRAADGWEGLLAIAEAAGGGWPKRARDAARNLNGLGRGLDAMTVTVQLLGDIEQILADKGVDRISSSDLVTALQAVEESDWSWVTKNILAKKLRGFGVKPHNVRIGEVQSKGYSLDGLEGLADAFRRYLQNGVPAVPNVPPQVAPTRDGTTGTAATASREERGEDAEPSDGLRVAMSDVRSDAGRELPGGDPAGQRPRTGDQERSPSSPRFRALGRTAGVGRGTEDEGPASGAVGLADDPATEMLAKLYALGGWARVVREITIAGFRQPDGKVYSTKSAAAAFRTRVAAELVESVARGRELGDHHNG